MKIGGVHCQSLPLDARTDRVRAAGDGAFGFDELGLFGVQKPLQPGAGGHPPSSSSSSPSTPEPAPARTPDDAGRANLRLADIEAAAPILPSSSEPELATNEAPVIEAGRPAPEFASSGPGPIAELPSAHPDQEFDPGKAATNLARVPPAGRQAGAALAMVVADRNGAIDIAIKAPPLDGESRALLRRLLRQVLSERRLSLGDLKLNGVPLEADFLSMTGGSPGTRAR